MGLGLVGLSVLGTVAAFLVDPAIGITVAVEAAAPAFLGGLAVLGYHIKRRYAPPGCHSLLRKLRACDAFDELEPVKAVIPLKPVVIMEAGSDRFLGTAEFRAGLLGARSKEHDIHLKISLQSLHSPEHILPTCSIVPSSWAAMEVTAPAEILARLPSLGREERGNDRFLWLLSHEDIENGAVEELLTSLNIAISSALSGPYR